MRRISASTAALLVLAVPVLFGGTGHAAQEAATRVFLNGVPTPVHFNDGDSFRVLDGEFAGARSRLKNFNTLESYGGVHSWGKWTANELYVNAKMGTLNARRGVWHCEGDTDDRDGYGRILWWCEDLAVDQIRKGYAHALTVTQEGAPQSLIDAQKEAIANRAGMWAHGVPAFVLTSTHSAAEGGGSDGVTYNRLASTKDGHSEKWIHNDDYSECQKVCYKRRPLSDETLINLVANARPKLPATFVRMTDEELARHIQNVVDIGHAGWVGEPTEDKDQKAKNKERSVELSEFLSDFLEDQKWEPMREEELSCMVHVDFRRRYGSQRASCLQK